MKRILIMLAGLLLPFGLAIAQKYALVDTEYILNQHSELQISTDTT